MKRLFIGKPLHWLIVVLAVAGMYWLGSGQFHRVNYTGFLFVVLGISVLAVFVVLFSYRQGDRITRDPLETESDD